ncbi:MAG: dynamin family protein, partial [Nannocystaceae bacterium]
MGEFSSGKSTFVNALLGEAIAPMGVLPTTSTINLFRRGPGGVARIHYRDGQISTLSRDQIHPFLQSLDDIEAARIRHIEIERSGVHMGDAAVVDTPGLNALDGFHETVARQFVDEADAVIWIFSATRGGSGSEASLLHALQADGRRVLGVLNKVDTLDEEERTELCEYLQEQLGEVLVDIIPVCASEALAHRSGEAPVGEDPFARIEQTLETVFFKQARTLKRTLTARRLADALKAARASVVEATKILQVHTQADDAQHRDAATEQLALRRFADKLHDVVLSHDDLLVREGLALGLLKSGSGTTRELTEQDVAYLNAVLRDNLLRGLQGAVQEMSRETDAPSVTQVLGEQLIPWARGYLASLDAAGFARMVLEERGAAIAKGEAAAMQEFRQSLVPIADAWRVFVRSLDRAVLRVRELHEHHRVAAPRAEILRLETTAIARLDALIERATAGEVAESKGAS